MNDPLVAHIRYLEGNYKADIEKWQGIKKKLESETTEAKSKIEEAEKGLRVLQEQKRKLGIG